MTHALPTFCNPASPPSFYPAFSPIKYGWDAALKLNYLQWVYEKYSPQNINACPLDITITGIESDVHALAFYFTEAYLGEDTITRFLLSSEGDEVGIRVLVKEFRTIFSCESPEFNNLTRPTLHQKIRSEIESLSHQMHGFHCAVAFLCGNHEEWGKSSNAPSLNEEMCKMIMAMLWEWILIPFNE